MEEAAIKLRKISLLEIHAKDEGLDKLYEHVDSDHVSSSDESDHVMPQPRAPESPASAPPAVLHALPSMSACRALSPAQGSPFSPSPLPPPSSPSPHLTNLTRPSSQGDDHEGQKPAYVASPARELSHGSITAPTCDAQSTHSVARISSARSAASDSTSASEREPSEREDPLAQYPFRRRQTILETVQDVRRPLSLCAQTPHS